MPDTQPMPMPYVDRLPGSADATSLIQLVSDALRNYRSTLALARSPLANSVLVAPALIKDEVSPTADERGHALRLLLRWAVNQLAPAASAFPLGTYRPLDDPTWRDPAWWRYNILRHRYLEPFHPDDFAGGGRFTETLLGLTGIGSSDAFYDERNRAVREVAAHLRQQALTGEASQALQQLALYEALQPLERQPTAAQVLAVAATFDTVFPRDLLLEMAAAERITDAGAALEALIVQRYLLVAGDRASLGLAPLLRAHIYAGQPHAERQRRHRLAAAHYATQSDTLAAARHWQRAGQDERAVQLLLPAVDTLVRELQVKEIIDLLQAIDLRRISPGQRQAASLELIDLYQRSGQPDAALDACRHALHRSEEPLWQARIYRRMGKLYETRNQLHALRYYQQALERLPPADPEVAEILKDRGWLHYLREEWAAAEGDLQQALRSAPSQDRLLCAAIYDALANLCRRTQRLEQAVSYAERALALREEAGDLLQIAKSQINLGLLYRTLGEHAPAIAAYREAMATYQRIGNQEMVAVALLNIGAAEFLRADYAASVAAYTASLAISTPMGLVLLAIKAHYNLAEALAACARQGEAASHWQLGYALCRQHNFDDQEADFLALGAAIGLAASVSSEGTGGEAAPAMTPGTALNADEVAVLELVQRLQVLTPKELMHSGNVSRATATRRLTSLVEKGYLQASGKGRAVAYRLATTPATSPAPPAGDDLQALLQAQQPTLRAQFAVAIVGLLPRPPAPAVKLVVRFVTLPDLPTYFALRRHLGDALGMAVDIEVELETVPYSSVTHPSDAEETDL